MNPAPRTPMSILPLLSSCLVLCAVACHRAAPGVDPATAITADAQGVAIAAGAPQWRYVEIATAGVGEPLVPLPVPAHVDFDPKRTAAVGVPLAGRVETVQVRAGARVQAGEKLFTVRSGAFAELDREIEAAHTHVAAKQRSAARAKGLLELKAVAQKEVFAAEAEQKEAELELKAAEAKRHSLAVVAEGDGLYWVVAPRGGTVVESELSPGLEVGPERDRPLVRLCDLDEVLVIADVPESDVRDVHVGHPVTIRPPFGATTRDGVVEHVSELVEPRRRTVEVWVRAQNGDRLLRPNAFVEVVLAADAAARVVRVPDVAVVTRGTRSVVFVEVATGRLEPRPVLLGRRRDGTTEVREGLQPGERFVARGALLLLNQVELASDL